VGGLVFRAVGWTQNLEEEVGELAGTLRVGTVQLQTDQLRSALAIECGAWKQAYARQLNRHCADVMDELHKYFRVMQRRLDHPLRDLEDIRTYKVYKQYSIATSPLSRLIINAT